MPSSAENERKDMLAVGESALGGDQEKPSEQGEGVMQIYAVVPRGKSF